MKLGHYIAATHHSEHQRSSFAITRSAIVRNANLRGQEPAEYRSLKGNKFVGGGRKGQCELKGRRTHNDDKVLKIKLSGQYCVKALLNSAQEVSSNLNAASLQTAKQVSNKLSQRNKLSFKKLRNEQAFQK